MDWLHASIQRLVHQLVPFNVMTRARSSPRPRAFDDLLYDVVSAPESEVESILSRCPEPELRAAVRRLLDREQTLGGFLTPQDQVAGKPEERRREGIGGWLATSVSGQLAANRRRIRGAGRNMFHVSGAFAPAFTLLHGFYGNDLHQVRLSELASAWGVVLVSWALASAARNRRLTDATVVGLGYLYLVLLCGLTGFMHATHEMHRYGQVTPFGPYLVFIGLLPLVLQAHLRLNLIVAGAATLAGLAGLCGGARVFSVAVDLPFVAEMASGLVLGFILMVMVHRSVTVLRSEVAAGLRLGSYRLTQKLGEGGMGEVWRASHPLLARPAAVKLVRSVHLDARPQERRVVVERFGREARTIATLESSHTVKLFDFGVAEDGNVFLVMELLDGIDLMTLVRSFGPQPADRVRAALLQICDSLAEAHGKGLVHRDVKPANIMLCRRGGNVDHVKVLDFGSVGLTDRPVGTAADLTHSGALLGTPAYLAPELLSGKSAADARSDIYSVGCVAYWLLVGRPVFDHVSAVMQIAAHVSDLPVPPSAIGVDLPEDLELAILSCLAKNPKDRPASAVDLASRLATGAAAGDWSMVMAQRWWTESLPKRPASDESMIEAEMRIRERPGAAASLD